MSKIALATTSHAKGKSERAGLLLKKLFKRFYDFWMILVKFLGRINTFILLTIIYFLIIGPLAIFLKLFKRDLLVIKFSNAGESYWLAKEAKPAKDYEQRF